MNVRRIAGVVLLSAAMAAATAAGVAAREPADERAPGKALKLRVLPQVANEPATVRITIEVEPDPRNRYVVVETDSGLFSRISQIPLAGERASRVHDFLYRGLPAGSYAVAATLFTPLGPRAFDSATLVVVSGAESPRGAEARP